eukprot:60121-Chlamydomonas_euryale.AAC.1
MTWGSSWFDCVSVEAGGGKIWYAQLRMIFKNGEALCAFVRWFQEERLVPGDELAKHGCIPLTWESDHGSGGRILPSDWGKGEVDKQLRVHALPCQPIQ